MERVPLLSLIYLLLKTDQSMKAFPTSKALPHSSLFRVGEDVSEEGGTRQKLRGTRGNVLRGRHGSSERRNQPLCFPPWLRRTSAHTPNCTQDFSDCSSPGDVQLCRLLRRRARETTKTPRGLRRCRRSAGRKWRLREENTSSPEWPWVLGLKPWTLRDGTDVTS